MANEAKPELECSVVCMAMASVYETIEISISAMPALKAYSILLISFVKWFSFTFFQEKISDNTDNLANLPERIAIVKQLDEEAKRLAIAHEEAKRLCLAQNDPRYKILDNQCFYFEKNHLNFDSANDNCQEKLGASGRLYEPKSVSEMKKVGKLGDELFPSSDNVWLGITDKRIESQFAYNSNGLPINFTPTWFSDYYGSRGKGNDCIFMKMPSTHSYFTRWGDYSCTSLWGSICQSNL